MNKFKIGDEVVSIGGMEFAFGRPRVKVIEDIEVVNGITRYKGGRMKNTPPEMRPFYTWFASENSLMLASEYKWPSELEMRIMDKKAQESMWKSFEEIANHHNEDGE